MHQTARLSLLLLIMLAINATPALSEEPIITERLANGTRLILQGRPGCGTYAMQVLALGGQLEDTDDQIGQTEVLSRMLLRGSLTRTAFEQALAIEQTGSTMEVTSGTLGFSLRAAGPAIAITEVTPVLVDAILNPRLDLSDLKTEIELARQRLVRSLDNPSTTRERAMRQILFGGHPLGRVPDPQTYLTELTPEQIRQTHRQRVVGARLIIVVVGGFDAASVRDQVASAFEDLPPGTAPVMPASPVPLAAERHSHAKRRTSQPEIVVALPTSGLAPEDEPVMDCLSHLLGGFQERLSTEIRENRGWAYWLDPVDWRLPNAGVFGVVTAVPKKHLTETERIIRQEFERIAATAPSDAEMDRTRRFLLTARARVWQQSSARVARYATDAARGLRVRDDTDAAVLLGEVTPDAVRGLARRLFDSSATVTVMLY